MNVVIVGAGQVGTDIARSLSTNHEITVMDVDSSKVEYINYNLDALGLEGDGTSPSDLIDAGIEEADLLIASTDNDQTNLVICGTGKAIGDPFTIARVSHRRYQDTWERAPGAFDVDYIVAADVLTSQKIVRIIGLPSAHDVDVFSEGVVYMAEFEVPQQSPVAGKTVMEADKYSSLTFAAVFRNGDVEVPSGDTVINGGDSVVVIGSPESVHEFAVDVVPGALDESNKVVVMGGTEIGYQLSLLLQDRGFEPMLIESDHERATWLAEELPGTMVMESDATDREFLERESIGDADVVVAAFDTDEKNLLSSLIASRMGTTREVAVVNNSEYVELFEAVGIDVAVNPREEVAEEIIRLTQENRTENLALIGGEQAEILEIEIKEDSVFANKTLSEADDELMDGVVVGAITREMELIPPRGETVIKPGDHVILFVDADVHDEIVDKF